MQTLMSMENEKEIKFWKGSYRCYECFKDSKTIFLFSAA